MISISNAIQLAKLACRKGHFAKLLLRTALMRTEANVRDALSLRPNVQPSVISIKLTNRCNLRCSMCMQWGISGTHRNFPIYEQREEIDVDLFRRIISEPFRRKPQLLLSGGEPLLHSRFDELIDVANASRLPTSIQTNGILLASKSEVIRSLRNGCYVLVSIDGNESNHDAIRGKNTYRKTLDGIANLRSRRDKRNSAPIIGVEITVTHKNANSIVELLNSLQDGLVDWVVLNLQWAITTEMGESYQSTITKLMGGPVSNRHTWSWRGFVDQFSLEEISTIKAVLKEIGSTSWKIPVVHQPPTLEGIDNFFNHPEIPSCARSRCRVGHHRIEVLPSGLVYSCKPFPDIPIGDLNRQSLLEVWNGLQMEKFRGFIRNDLMAVCAKCPMLYTFGK